MAAKTTPFNLIERFNEKWTPEPNSGCFLWTGAASSKQYGNFRINGKIVGAHRVAWQIKNGPIPSNLFVLHKCDMPPCVNPDHLFLGTNADNMADMARKGRKVVSPNAGKHGNQLKGEANGRAKLNIKQVREIREEFARTKNGAALARKFGISETQTRRVISGKSWGPA